VTSESIVNVVFGGAVRDT